MTSGPDHPGDHRSMAVGDVGVARSERFHYADPQEIRRFLDTAFTPSWQLEKWSIGLSVTVQRHAAHGIVIDDFEVKGTLRCEVRTAHSIVVIQPRSGSLAVAGDAIAGTSPIVVTAATAPCALEAESARFSVVAIDASLLRKVAHEANLAGPAHIQFTSSTTSSPASTRVWHRTLDYVIAGLNDTDIAPQPLMVRAATRMLAAATLECFPSNVTTREHVTGLSEASHTFKQAVAFMYEHAGHDIGMADIAAAVKLTARAVQYVFRQEANMTPTAYLRRIRLDRARDDLISGDTSNTTVAEVARKWGFGHVGRFSAHYRQTYGEAPRTTLAT